MRLLGLLVWVATLSFGFGRGFCQTLHHHLMPTPIKVQYEVGKFRINSHLAIKQSQQSSQRVNHAIRSFLSRVGKYTHLSLNWLDFPTDHPNMLIQYETTVDTLYQADESYRLAINDKRILIDAKTDVGILRALETLIQSIAYDDGGFYFPAMTIEDYPRFTWRGLLLDVCRHYIEPGTIKNILSAMAHSKLNVLHWHLSEDQGFRIESKVFPNLHNRGSDGLYYTQEVVKDIVSYANLLGIRVVPELDMPGHASAWLAAYPELGSGKGPYYIERHFGVFNPTIDPTNKKTYGFLHQLIREMSSLFPDPFFHIGGDENNGHEWSSNEKIQQFMQKNNIKDQHELQNYFNLKVARILKKYHKRMVGWDEIFQPGLDTNAVIQSWRGKQYLYDAVKKGHHALLSNGYYIDLSQAAAFHYLQDPLPMDHPLSEVEVARVLGGEATMWAELVDNDNIETRIWPRALAIAERFWSDGKYRDTDDMYRRLQINEKWLELSGSRHIQNREALIRRISLHVNPEVLKDFLDWIEPIKGYKRHSTAPGYTTWRPLSRPVDAATPDCRAAIRWRATRSEIEDTAILYRFYTDELEGLLRKCEVWTAAFEGHIHLSCLIPLVSHLEESAKAGLLMIKSMRANKQSAEQLIAWKELLAPHKEPIEELEIKLPDLLLEAYAKSMP